MTLSLRRRTVLGRVLTAYAVVSVSFALVIGFSVVGQRVSARETETIAHFERGLV